MKDKLILWTIQGRKVSGEGRDARIVYAPSQQFATKRAAIVGLMPQRRPKSAILRFGHNYVFDLAE